MANETTYTKTISRIERKRSSVNGNPRFELFFTDGTSASTAVDAGVAYGIENPEYRRGPVEFTVTSRGQIVNAKPVQTEA